MASYHQMGHHSENLMREPRLQGFAGVVLSPVNFDEEQTASQIESCRRRLGLDTVFDPQLYYPRSERGRLASWHYFPRNAGSLDIQSVSWWRGLTNKLMETCARLRPDAVCSPAFVPRAFTDEYFSNSVKLCNDLAGDLSNSETRLIQTLLVNLSDLAESGKAMRIASIMSRTKAESIYLVIVSNREPRREFCDEEELKGAMKLISALENSGLPVLVGFSSSDMALWKLAGATSCATGKFFNLRRFTSSRFAEPSDGGTPMAYWFEEALMAYLRESDVIRVRTQGAFSEASTRNPFAKEILKCIDDAQGQPWIALAWRQWMYAFSDLEKRIDRGTVDVSQLLRSADNAWSALDNANVLMEERQNNGAWVRAWRRAINEYETESRSPRT